MKLVWKLIPALYLCAVARAQELRTQPTPFTVWLDFNALAKPAAARASFPIWLESVEIAAPKPDEPLSKNRIRLRLRRFAGLSDQLMLRLFFDDRKESAPVVSAWTELGHRVVSPTKLGGGVGLPTSETLIIPASQADYIEIDVPADAESLPSALLTSLKKTETLHALDFAAPAPLYDLFDAGPPAVPAANDAFLFGRVKATLEKGTRLLSANEDASGAFEFQLETQPLLAVLTFEVLDADVAAPPEARANGRDFGPAVVILPDLADPAYRGKVRSAERDVQFRYAGWLKCQMAIPGSYLRAGANSISLKTADSAGAVAIRAVEVQLKYASDNPPVP